MLRKWYKKNENTLNKISAIIFILSFIDLFILNGSNNVLPIIIIIWLFYSIYKEGGLFKWNYKNRSSPTLVGFFIFKMIVRFIRKIKYDMKLEYKSMFIGIVLGAVSVSTIFFLLVCWENLPYNISKKQDKTLK